jgi:LacI family transcriptional regulator
VQAAAEQLGYRPNLTASNLRRGDRRTNTIGLLVEDVGNPFSAAVHPSGRGRGPHPGADGAVREPRGGTPIRERELARALDRPPGGRPDHRPGDTDYRWVVAEQQAGIGVRLHRSDPQPPRGRCDHHRQHRGRIVGRGAPDQAGRRPRVAYLGDDLRIQTAAARYDGYRQALVAAGVDEDPRWVSHGLRTLEDAREAARAMLDALTRDRTPFSAART